MSKFKNTILLTDLDGTLFKADATVSQKNIDALNYFTQNGGRFGVCTGRAMVNAMSYLKGVPINFYSVFCNGAFMYDMNNQAIAKTYSVDKQKMIPIIEGVLREQPNIGVQIHNESTINFVSPKEILTQKIIDNHYPCNFVKLEDVMEMEWIKVVFNGNNEQLEWVKEYTEEQSKGVFERVKSSTMYYEFLSHGISKGSMLEEMRTHLTDKDKIYAVGDYYNDEQMILKADVGIITSNAPDDLKAVADFTCNDNSNDALADVIDRIIKV